MPPMDLNRKSPDGLLANVRDISLLATMTLLIEVVLRGAIPSLSFLAAWAAVWAVALTAVLAGRLALAVLRGLHSDQSAPARLPPL